MVVVSGSFAPPPFPPTLALLLSYEYAVQPPARQTMSSLPCTLLYLNIGSEPTCSMLALSAVCACAVCLLVLCFRSLGIEENKQIIPVQPPPAPAVVFGAKRTRRATREPLRTDE